MVEEYLAFELWQQILTGAIFVAFASLWIYAFYVIIHGNITLSRVATKWEAVREEILSSSVEVASIATKNFAEIIEVRVPTRFYWNADKTFDGIEFGEFKTTLQPWQEAMMNRCLDAMIPAIGEKHPETE